MPNSSEYNKQYYSTHKHAYQCKYNAKKRCDVCNKEISGSNFADHLKTKAHQTQQQVRQLQRDVSRLTELLAQHPVHQA